LRQQIKNERTLVEYPEEIPILRENWSDVLTAELIGGAVIVDVHLYGVLLALWCGASIFAVFSRSTAVQR
jgi:hypothetical protein